MQQALRTKLLVGILASVTALGVLLAHQSRANHQTAVEVHKLADEREKAAQIDRDDKAAIQKIRERNAQKTATAPTKKPCTPSAYFHSREYPHNDSSSYGLPCFFLAGRPRRRLALSVHQQFNEPDYRER